MKPLRLLRFFACQPDQEQKPLPNGTSHQRIAPAPNRIGTAFLFLVPVCAMVGACVQVSAPKKPIEINLNINVRQEVVVRLRQDAQDFVTSNPELFPQ